MNDFGEDDGPTRVLPRVVKAELRNKDDRISTSPVRNATPPFSEFIVENSKARYTSVAPYFLKSVESNLGHGFIIHRRIPETQIARDK